MVIVIGTNGDRYWCQWHWGAPSVPLGPSPLAPFLLPLAPWRELQIIKILLPKLLYTYFFIFRLYSNRLLLLLLCGGAHSTLPGEREGYVRKLANV